MSQWRKESLDFHDLQRILFKLSERVEILRDFAQTELLLFLEIAEKCIFNPGDTILREGSTGAYLYIVIDGQVAVHKSDSKGQQVELARLGAAETFGEMSLIDHEARSATVTALSTCILLRLSEKQCWKHTSISAKLFRNIAHVLAQRLRETNTHALQWRLGS